MIELVDAHVKNRLEILRFEGSPITVYDYLPERKHGETIYPCLAFTRQFVEPAMELGRPNVTLFIPSEQYETIDVDEDMGGGQVTGPMSYTAKPYPTPVVVVYEIHARATDPSHIVQLEEALFQLFPPGYQANVGDQSPLFLLGSPTNNDDLSLPVYQREVLLDVTDLMLDRAEAFAVTPIKDLEFETGTTT